MGFSTANNANLRFYDGYDPKFLFRKADLLYAIYLNREPAAQFLKAIGGTQDETEEQFLTGIAVELYCSVFHQIEAMFALLTAVFQPLPHWVYLTQYKTAEIKTLLEQFVTGQYAELTGKTCNSCEEFVAKSVYCGVDLEGLRWQKTLDDVGWFLVQMAERYTAGHDEYNSYKHGLRVLPGQGRLMINVGKEAEEFRPVLSMKHSISVLKIETRSGTGDCQARQVTREINPEDAFQSIRIMTEIAEAVCKTRLACLRGEHRVQLSTFELDRSGLVRLRPRAKFEFPL